MWKAKASEKLGIVTARERAAIEYRDSLKQRWKFDPEVGKIARYVPFLPSTSVPRSIAVLALATCQSPCTKLHSSKERCWRHSVSRKSAAASTRVRARTSPRRSGRRSSSPSSHDPVCRGLRLHVYFTSLLVHALCGLRPNALLSQQARVVRSMVGTLQECTKHFDKALRRHLTNTPF